MAKISVDADADASAASLSTESTPTTSRPSTKGAAFPTDDASTGQRFRRCVQDTILASPWFAVLMTMVNIVNCILIGFETDCRVSSNGVGLCSKSMEVVLLAFEYVFVTFITLEFIMQLLVNWRYLCTAWGIFDFVIVLASLFNAILIQPLFVVIAEAKTLSKIPGLRVFRLLRLTRSLVKLMRFPELWVMVTGLLSALRAIAWTITFGTLIIYIFAVLGVEAFASAGPAWSRVGKAMVTLLQIATLDAWTSVVKPVWHIFPISGHIFVLLFVVVVALTLGGLITATLTERAIAVSKQAASVEVSAQLQDRLRSKLQSDNMTKHELEMIWVEDHHAQTGLKVFGTLEELKELFDLVAGSSASAGSIKLDVFHSFLLQYKQDRIACLSMLTLQHLRSLRRHVLGMEHLMEASRMQQLAVMSGTNWRCAQVSAQIREEHEAVKCRQDASRVNQLCRDGFDEIDVTKVRHVFEANDSLGRGELDFIGFSSLFPRIAPNKISDLWNSIACGSACTIDFDEFLDAVGRYGPKKFLKYAKSRPPQQIDFDAEGVEDVKKLAVQVADVAADRVMGRVLEQAALHAAKCVADRFAETEVHEKWSFAVGQIVDQVVQNVAAQVSDRLSQHAADCSIVGTQIVEEMRQSIISFQDRQKKCCEESLAEHDNENSEKHQEPFSVPTQNEAVIEEIGRSMSELSACGNRDAAKAATGQGGNLMLERLRPPPLVLESSSASSHKASPLNPPPRKLLPIPTPSQLSYHPSDVDTSASVHRGEDALRKCGSAGQQDPLWLQQSPMAGILAHTPSMVSLSPKRSRSYENAYSMGTSAARAAADAGQSSYGVSGRPCLLTKMETLAHQVREIHLSQ